MTLEGIGVTQPSRGFGVYQLRLKFGPQAYRVIELTKGDDGKSLAKKLRELTEKVSRLKA
jgi:hypothetical protein